MWKAIKKFFTAPWALGNMEQRLESTEKTVQELRASLAAVNNYYQRENEQRKLVEAELMKWRPSVKYVKGGFVSPEAGVAHDFTLSISDGAFREGGQKVIDYGLENMRNIIKGRFEELGVFMIEQKKPAPNFT